MKKALTILGSFATLGATMLSVVACATPNIEKPKPKINLSQVAKIAKTLPKLNNDQNDTIIAAFVKANKQTDQINQLQIDDLEIKSKPINNVAVISIKDSHRDYQGAFYVQFELKTDLSEDIDLGSFNSINKTIILKTFLKIKQDDKIFTKILKTSDFIIDTDPKGVNAVISIKDEQPDYCGSFYLTYKVKEKLSQLAGIVTELPLLKEKSEKAVLAAFMQANQNILPTEHLPISDFKVRFSLLNDQQATISIVHDNQDYQGELVVTFLLKKDLSLTPGLSTYVVDLGIFDQCRIMETWLKVNQHLEGIKDLQIKDLKLTLIKFTTYEISIIDTHPKYQGTFSILMRKTIDFDKIPDMQFALHVAEWKTDHDVLQAFYNANHSILAKYNLDRIEEFEILERPTTDSAIIRIKSHNEYVGQCTVTFTLKKNIMKLSLTKDFPNFKNKSNAEILEAFLSDENNKKILPNLKKENCIIVHFDGNKGGLLIISDSDNDYDGVVFINLV